MKVQWTEKERVEQFIAAVPWEEVWVECREPETERLFTVVKTAENNGRLIIYLNTTKEEIKRG
jgi:hypothetical protein